MYLTLLDNKRGPTTLSMPPERQQQESWKRYVEVLRENDALLWRLQMLKTALNLIPLRDEPVHFG